MKKRKPSKKIIITVLTILALIAAAGIKMSVDAAIVVWQEIPDSGSSTLSGQNETLAFEPANETPPASGNGDPPAPTGPPAAGPRTQIGWSTPGPASFTPTIIIECTDADSDGYDGYDAVTCPEGTDCDDGDPAINPGADEACNGVDDNCNDQVDEGIEPIPTTCGIGQCAAEGETYCSEGQFMDTCEPAEPGQETCDDGLDNDCDGTVDCDDYDCFESPSCETEPIPAPEFAFFALPLIIIGLVLGFSYRSAKNGHF